MVNAIENAKLSLVQDHTSYTNCEFDFEASYKASWSSVSFTNCCFNTKFEIQRLFECQFNDCSSDAIITIISHLEPINRDADIYLHEQICRGSWQSFALSKLAEQVTEAHLPNSWLCQMPPHMEAFTNLSVLNLSGNKIQDIPENKLPRTLSKLNLRHNKLTAIPADVFHCVDLTQLDVSKNHIQHAPNSLNEQLPKLTTYNAADQRL